MIPFAQTSDQDKVKPEKLSGSIRIAGKDVLIRPDAVDSTRGTQPGTLIAGLKTIVRKGLFLELKTEHGR